MPYRQLSMKITTEAQKRKYLVSQAIFDNISMRDEGIYFYFVLQLNKKKAFSHGNSHIGICEGGVFLFFLKIRK